MFIFTSSNCVFHEHIFPYTRHPPTQLNDAHILNTTSPIHFSLITPITTNSHSNNNNIPNIIHSPVNTNNTPDVHTPPANPHNIMLIQSPYTSHNHDIANSPDVANTRKSMIHKNAPAYLKYFLCHASHNSILYDTSYTRLSPAYHSFISIVPTACDPISYKQASVNPYWVKAMQAGIQALTDNNTWYFTTHPSGKKAI
ncbi:unnamed protein product [Vicia faba]|uniref:Uncharacterized protein n=1 Tax=Vicia faba TaxID=3906 RepID=A0AAV1A7X1_VICFA|nr:unnamed protein product [Vicia faba]